MFEEFHNTIVMLIEENEKLKKLAEPVDKLVQNSLAATKVLLEENLKLRQRLEPFEELAKNALEATRTDANRRAFREVNAVVNLSNLAKEREVI